MSVSLAACGIKYPFQNIGKYLHINKLMYFLRLSSDYVTDIYNIQKQCLIVTTPSFWRLD